MVLAYEMNGEPLPPDHGFPVRVVVPSWIGISSIKWVGRIEVSDRAAVLAVEHPVLPALRPGLPGRGQPPLTRQVVKSAFELAARRAAAGRPATRCCTGRSWSGNGGIRRVEVSTDGGATWRRADLFGPAVDTGWRRWQLTWRPAAPGRLHLLARATDETGATQPDVAPYNTLGYLFGAVVRHPVTVSLRVVTRRFGCGFVRDLGHLCMRSGAQVSESASLRAGTVIHRAYVSENRQSVARGAGVQSRFRFVPRSSTGGP